MRSWCRVHGDVTACPCRPVPKKYFKALQATWHRASHDAKVRQTARNGVRVTLAPR